VVNIDDESGAALAGQLAGRPLDLWTVSCRMPARLQATGIRFDGQGLHFTVCEGEAQIELATHLIGHYNVANLLGVIAAMRTLGVPLVAAVEACRALHPVPGRMECLGGNDQPLVVVDYAHTPDALAQVLQALRPLAAQRDGQLWCIFGCGGDRDPLKRPIMGAVASQHADQVVLTSDNPRSEKPEIIISQIPLGLEGQDAVSVQGDRAQAIAQTLQQAGVRDVVLLAGKGHEDYQETTGVRAPFSDRAEVLKALQTRAVRRQGAHA
jgi:UDP-N-acetylmuramyl-tripeptide synthetase